MYIYIYMYVCTDLCIYACINIYVCIIMCMSSCMYRKMMYWKLYIKNHASENSTCGDAWCMHIRIHITAYSPSNVYVYINVSKSIYPSVLNESIIYLFVGLSLYLLAYLSIHSSVYLQSTNQSFSLSIYLKHIYW